MESAVVSRNIRHSRRHLLPGLIVGHPHRPETPTFLRWQRKQSPTISCVAGSAPPDPTSTATTTYSSSSWNGWGDLASLSDSASSSEEVVAFDGRSAVLFVLGSVTALAVSRARLSTLAIVPVSILVFVAGLLVGVARDDAIGGYWSKGDRRVSDERRMDDLVRFMDALDGKMVDLKGELERIVSGNRAELGEIRRWLGVLESVRVEAATAKKFVEDYETAGFFYGSVDSEMKGERKSNQKSTKGRKEMSAVVSEFGKFVGGLFQESLMSAAASKTPKAKEIGKREPAVQMNLFDKHKVNGLVGEAEENARNLTHMDDASVNKELSLEPTLDRKAVKREGLSESLRGVSQHKINGIFQEENGNEVPINSYSVLNGKHSHARSDKPNVDGINGQENINRSFSFTNRQRSLEAMILQSKSLKRNTQTSRMNLKGKVSSKGGINAKSEETNVCMLSESESSLQSQSMFKIRSRPHLNSDGKKTNKVSVEHANYRSESRGGTTVEDSYTPDDLQSGPNMASTSTIANADGFSEKLQEATELLKQAREYLRNGFDEEMADAILYESADLLSVAVASKPMSLLAVGQLGNTLLLHGELKLKFSREMRTLLSKDDLFEFDKIHGSSNLTLSKGKVTSTLVDVCEECEDLLIEAGRNYRMALSIDGSDIRALYNWGLALYLRAELLADVGPEAAFDADRVYLAAIDKFAAMTSRSNDCAPDALLKWGLALQQRSNLRLHNRKEKMKFLKQAKSLFEEVLSTDSNNRPAREALMSCLSDIKYSRQF